MTDVRLKFKSVSEIVGTEDIGLLILVDEEEKRQLTITCDRSMLVQFRLRIQHVPIVNLLLPEVLWQTLGEQSGASSFRIVITDLMEGQYRVVLCRQDTQEMISIRAGDGVLLSYISGIPIYIESVLMQKQSVAYQGESSGLAIPVNTITDDMLAKALEKAISTENYELASRLRDEKYRRLREGRSI